MALILRCTRWINLFPGKNFSAPYVTRTFSPILGAPYRSFRLSLASRSQIRDSAMFQSKIRMEKLRRGDRLPPDYELVYRAPLSLYFAFSQCLTYASFFLISVLGIQYFYLGDSSFLEMETGSEKLLEEDVTEEERSYFDVTALVRSPTQLAVMLGVYSAMCLSIMVITHRYPIRIYRRGKDEYRAIFYGLVPWSKQQVLIQAGEVTKEERRIAKIVPWMQSYYRTKSRRSLILVEEYFRTPHEYNHLLGYDKMSPEK